MTDSSAFDFEKIEKPIEILQFSDLHLLSQPSDTLTGINTEESFRSIINAARKLCWPPDLILLTGDLSQDPELATYERLRRHLDALGLPCYCLPGNHDKPIMHQVLNSEKVSCTTQIHAGNWQIICLDSTIPNAEGGFLSESTLQILINNLDQFPSKNVLIALHHHPLPIGCTWLDTMVLKNGDELFSVLRNYPQVMAIVCGHIHQEMEIKSFSVIERDGLILGCAALKPFPDKASGELACVALHPDYQGESRGTRLMEHIEINAIAMGLKKIFVLTTQTTHWFREHGFEPTSAAELPVDRQVLYNFQRNSKILVKTL